MFERGDERIKAALKFALRGEWEQAIEHYKSAMHCGISTLEYPVQHEFERMAVMAGKMAELVTANARR